MMLNRLLVIALSPLLGGALAPWLQPASVAVAGLCTVVWVAFVVVFMAGFCVANRVGKTLRPIERLKVLALIMVAFLALAVVAIYWFVSPLLALGLAALLVFLQYKNIQTTQAWAQLAMGTAGFVERITWVAIGCLLMLALSYWRQLQVA